MTLGTDFIIYPKIQKLEKLLRSKMENSIA